MKKVFLKILQNSQENTCARVFFLITFIKKENLAQSLSCEFCEIFKKISQNLSLEKKSTFLYRRSNIFYLDLK